MSGLRSFRKAGLHSAMRPEDIDSTYAQPSKTAKAGAADGVVTHAAKAGPARRAFCRCLIRAFCVGPLFSRAGQISVVVIDTAVKLGLIPSGISVTGSVNQGLLRPLPSPLWCIGIMGLAGNLNLIQGVQ
jgi:hypothetical protein